MTIGEVGQLMTGVAALYAAISSNRNGKKIDEVHKSTNGKMEQLLQVTRAASFAEGRKEQKEQGDA
jgi:hypothetical protein